MKAIFILIFYACMGLAMSQDIALQDYYPLDKDTKRTYYVSHIDGKKVLVDEPGSTYCRSMKIKGREIFYFEEKGAKKESTIIGSESFSQGVFYYQDGAFWYSPIFWKKDLMIANPDYFEVLFPAKLTIDSVYKYKDGEKIMKFRFVGFETIAIKGKTYESCLKLRLQCDWPTDQYIDFVWLEKGFGVVKWLRGTGRLEEILE